MSEHTIEFIKSTVDRFPELRNLYQSHTSDNLGETLPHVFFGEIVRFWLSVYQRGCGDHLPELARLHEFLVFLENSFVHGDRDVKELIAVSFLENLPGPGEMGTDLRELLGPSLKHKLREGESWKPE